MIKHRRVRWPAVAAAALVLACLPAPLASARQSATTVTAQWSPEPASYGVGSEQNVPVTMNDGTILRVDVYYPTDPATGLPAKGPFPSLLTQTPYGKNDPGTSQLGGGESAYLVERGYIEVVADVRGRGASQGTWDVWSPRESEDGVALADWAAKLPDSTGKVGLFGGSYMGITQLMTASHAPANSPIAAEVPVVAINNVPSDGFEGGMPNGGFGLMYSGLIPATGAASLGDDLDLTDPSDLLDRSVETGTTSALWSAALDGEMMAGGTMGYFDDYWKERSPVTYDSAIAEHQIPTLMIGGWDDIMGPGPLNTFTELQNVAADEPKYGPMLAGEPLNSRFQVVMGPWTHLSAIASPLTQALELRWFDHWLKGENNGATDAQDPVHLQVQGTSDWLDEPSWPVPGATDTTYYLGPSTGSDGGSLSLNHGSLTTTPPAADATADKVAWTGASSPCSVRLKVQTAGLEEILQSEAGIPLDLSDVCGAADDESTEAGALTYTTAPVSQAETIAGPLNLNLYASSSTRDAEFIVGLEAVNSQGTPVSVSSGALLGSERALDTSQSWYDAQGKLIQAAHPFTKASVQALTPGKISQFEVTVHPTAIQLAPGERLRVTISTSDVPFAIPNAETLPNLAGSVDTIVRDSGHPSSITVPFVPSARLTPDCSICGSTPAKGA